MKHLDETKKYLLDNLAKLDWYDSEKDWFEKNARSSVFNALEDESPEMRALLLLSLVQLLYLRKVHGKTVARLIEVQNQLDNTFFNRISRTLKKFWNSRKHKLALLDLQKTAIFEERQRPMNMKVDSFCEALNKTLS